MRAKACNSPYNSLSVSSTFSTCISRQTKFVNLGLGFRSNKTHLQHRILQIRKSTSLSREIRAINGRKGNSLSPWDDKPYELLPSEKKAYFDEQDIVSFLDPPKELIPLDPSSYNPAGYLWKKIDDIPEERRYRLLYLLNPRLISRIWGIAGTRYEDSKLAKKTASNFLSDGDNVMPLEFWNCRTSGGRPMPISWINFFKKVIFCKDGQTYGRILVGGPILGGIANSFSPLYFTVRNHKEVMSTEQPCDSAYEFGDGLLDLHDYPHGFPKAEKITEKDVFYFIWMAAFQYMNRLSNEINDVSSFTGI
ncbi:hypothetical protein BVC80_729g13 [Macleaya cordata]|uniref:Uncharacterized protein n=1 Tax=Macleaya cordata TaxID=56857 RepID=A0A200PSI3_MACCD|nr:hypothetical protein BVC80_729g13 [Macleaya cordata]